ncbi:hypothetical protein G6F31_021716 [Rhizopus arrhizus]|nr:hypothetical protein G6F31_021716 [Rhizopus arrhizus]
MMSGTEVVCGMPPIWPTSVSVPSTSSNGRRAKRDCAALIAAGAAETMNSGAPSALASTAWASGRPSTVTCAPMPAASLTAM